MYAKVADTRGGDSTRPERAQWHRQESVAGRPQLERHRLPLLGARNGIGKKAWQD